MPNPGAFDADARALAQFDPTAVAGGWYEYGLPFFHPLIDAGAAPPDTFPPVPAIFLNLLLRLCWLGGALLSIP